ncbi:MAG TPA: transposase [Nitrospiraceae bacterium]|nr:transposase [Nitrospiraceae bacterium]
MHYHMVFPVKYRKGLLDEAVTAIIQETAAEIAERFLIEMEAMATYGQESYPSALQCTSEFDANQVISTILFERSSRCFYE